MNCFFYNFWVISTLNSFLRNNSRSILTIGSFALSTSTVSKSILSILHSFQCRNIYLHSSNLLIYQFNKCYHKRSYHRKSATFQLHVGFSLLYSTSLPLVIPSIIYFKIIFQIEILHFRSKIKSIGNKYR